VSIGGRWQRDPAGQVGSIELLAPRTLALGRASAGWRAECAGRVRQQATRSLGGQRPQVGRVEPSFSSDVSWRAYNGLELSRPTALGSPSRTLLQHQWAFESPFSRAVEVGSSELLGRPKALRSLAEVADEPRDCSAGYLRSAETQGMVAFAEFVPFDRREGVNER